MDLHLPLALSSVSRLPCALCPVSVSALWPCGPSHFHPLPSVCPVSVQTIPPSVCHVTVPSFHPSVPPSLHPCAPTVQPWEAPSALRSFLPCPLHYCTLLNWKLQLFPACKVLLNVEPERIRIRSPEKETDLDPVLPDPAGSGSVQALPECPPPVCCRSDVNLNYHVCYSRFPKIKS